MHPSGVLSRCIIAATLVLSICGCDGPPTPRENPDFNNEWILAANTGANTISVFKSENNAGILGTATTYPTGTAPRAIAWKVVRPTGALDHVYIYVANSGDNTISQYELFRGGTVKPLTPATVAAGSTPVAFVTDLGPPADDRKVFVVNAGDNTVFEYSVGDLGQLTRLKTFTTGAHPVSGYRVGSTLFVANQGDNTLSQYWVASGVDLPTAPTATYPTGTSPNGIAGYSHDALYVTNGGSNSISVFPLNGDSGAPKIKGAAVVFLLLVNPQSITEAGSSEVYYVPTDNGHVVAVGTLSSSPTTLNLFDNAGYPTGSGPKSVVTNVANPDPYTYVANSADGTVSQFGSSRIPGPLFQIANPAPSGQGTSFVTWVETSPSTTPEPASTGVTVPVK